MLPGYNHNIRYREKVFHVQTEDNGLSAPDLVTQVFLGGQIVAIERSNYRVVLSQSLDDKARDQRIKALMQEQHKRLLKNLISGLYDAKIATFKSEPTPQSAPNDVLSEASPFDAIQFEEPVMLDGDPLEDKGASPSEAARAEVPQDHAQTQASTSATRAEDRAPPPRPAASEARVERAAEPPRVEPAAEARVAAASAPVAQPPASRIDGVPPASRIDGAPPASRIDSAPPASRAPPAAHAAGRERRNEAPEPDFSALDAAIAAAAEREGGPMLLASLPSREGKDPSQPFPLTEDLDIQPQRPKRLKLDPDLALAPGEARRRPEPGAKSQAPSTSQSPPPGTGRASPPQVAAPPKAAAPSDDDDALDIPTYRGKLIEVTPDDDVPTQMMKRSVEAPSRRESTSPMPGASKVDSPRSPPKSSDTLIDFGLPAALRREIDNELKKRPREPAAPPPSPPSSASADVRVGPRNPRAALFRSAMREEERPSSPKASAAPSPKAEEPAGDTSAKLGEAFKHAASRLPSRARAQSRQADTMVDMDRRATAEKIAERARASLLGQKQEGRPNPAPQDPTQLVPRPRSASSTPNDPPPKAPSAPAPASDDPRRPSILVVERSLDEVILGYLHDDMAEE